METLFLIVSSVLITLGIIAVIWLLSSVRSVQKQLKNFEAEINELPRYIDEMSNESRRGLADTKREIDKEVEHLYNDLDKRFDNSYRTMYEFRDWAKEQIERLIETDLQNK